MVACADDGVEVGVYWKSTDLRAKYETEYPSELLLHMPFPFLPLVDWLQRYEQLLRARVDGSVFRRVCMFSSAERTTDGAVKQIYP